MPIQETGPILITGSGEHRLDLRVADGFLSRFAGLIFSRPLRPRQGLLITRCPGVHCAFMRFAIDVVYLDRFGSVIRCVPGLRPWRASFSAVRTAHTLELAAGAIEALDIRAGDRLCHPQMARRQASPAQRAASWAQRGAAMVEFTVVGPVITLLGLSILQYGMLFFAKDQINYAGFMAAREGSTTGASIAAVHSAYVQALVPLYGGGQTPAELAASLAKASSDVDGNVKIELLNPTRESFADWNDPALQQAFNTGSQRVIPNAGQAFKPSTIGATSGQTIQDANLIKLRITHGYQPKVPLVSKLYTIYLKGLDPKTDAFHTKLVEDGRIPVVTHVTLQMQSDAIEPGAPVSAPGPGNGGNPTNPGDPPVSTNPPPDCTNYGCNTPTLPPRPPVCNPLTDPERCVPDECVPTPDMCCLPK